MIPEKSENVDVKQDSGGNTHLRLNVRLTGLKKKIADLFRFDYTRKVELDHNGSYFFGLVDGRTTLDAIVESMMAKMETNRQETERMVILFTRKLMVMGMVVLKVPDRPDPD